MLCLCLFIQDHPSPVVIIRDGPYDHNRNLGGGQTSDDSSNETGEDLTSGDDNDDTVEGSTSVDDYNETGIRSVSVDSRRWISRV